MKSHRFEAGRKLQMNPDDVYKNVIAFCLGRMRDYRHQAYCRGDQTQMEKINDHREFVFQALEEAGLLDEFMKEYTTYINRIE